MQRDALELGWGERSRNGEAQDGGFPPGKRQGKPVRRNGRLRVQAVRQVGGSVETFHHQAGKLRGSGHAPALGVHEGEQVQGFLVPVLDRHSQEPRRLGVIPGGQRGLLWQAGKIGGDVHEQDAQLLHGLIASSGGGTVEPFHPFFRPGAAGAVRRHEEFPQYLLGHRVAGFGQLFQSRQHVRRGVRQAENVPVPRGRRGDCRHEPLVGRVMHQGRFRRRGGDDEADFREGLLRAFRFAFEARHLHGDGLVGGGFKGVCVGAVRGELRQGREEEGGGGLPRHREGGDGVDGTVHQGSVGVPDGEVQFLPSGGRRDNLEVDAGDAQLFRQDGGDAGTGQNRIVQAQLEFLQRPRFQRRVFRHSELRDADGCQVPGRRGQFLPVGGRLLDGLLDGIDGGAHGGLFQVVHQVERRCAQQQGADAPHHQEHHVAVAAEGARGQPAGGGMKSARPGGGLFVPGILLRAGMRHSFRMNVADVRRGYLDGGGGFFPGNGANVVNPFTGRLVAAAGLGSQRLVQRKQELPRVIAGEHGVAVQRRHAVFRQAHFRPFRRVAREEGVKGGAYGIKVAPGADVRFPQRLFRGGIPLGGQDGGGMQLQGMARRAEVDQHGRAFLRQQDVAGLDVTVVDVPGMEVVQNPQQAGQQALEFVLRVAVPGAVEFLPQVVQGKPGDVLHGEVGGAVGFKNGQDSDDAGMVELRQRLGLAQETLQGPGVVFQVVLVVGPDMPGQRVPVGAAGGKVFLDDHVAVQEQVLRQVGDAEAPAAQDADDFILFQARAGGQLPLVNEKGAFFFRVGERGASGQNLFQACRWSGRRDLPCRPGLVVWLAFFCWHEGKFLKRKLRAFSYAGCGKSR